MTPPFPPNSPTSPNLDLPPQAEFVTFPPKLPNRTVPPHKKKKAIGHVSCLGYFWILARSCACMYQCGMYQKHETQRINFLYNRFKASLNYKNKQRSIP